MKKTLIPISVALLMLTIAILAGCSKDSTSSNPNNPPSAPGSLNAAQSQNKYVDLGWTNPGNVDTFNVQRAPDSAAWATIGTLNGNATTFRDSTQSANRVQYYRVRGVNTHGTGDWAVTSLWTLPGVWDFSNASQLDNFIHQDLDGGTYSTWTPDPNEGGNGAGKFSFTNPTGNQRLSRVVTNDNNKMPNQGWFESKIKVAQWIGTGNDANYASFFVERDYTNASDNVVGIFFSGDSTVFGYYSSGSGQTLLTRVATNPTLPLLSSGQWHTVRLFHRNAHWTLYLDNNQAWDGELPNVANGSYQLYEEWQFDRGTATGAQNFWIDDVANNHATPAFTINVNEGNTLSAPRMGGAKAK